MDLPYLELELDQGAQPMCDVAAAAVAVLGQVGFAAVRGDNREASVERVPPLHLVLYGR